MNKDEKNNKENNILNLIPKTEKYIQYVIEMIIKIPRTEKYSIGTEYKLSIYKMLESIIGLNKIEEKRKTPAQLTQKLDKDKTIIVIDHQPKELQDIADAGVDLDLCGHTHDGQTFPGNFTGKFLWENPCGYLQKGSMHNIVTSGSGVWGPAMRVGTDSEICTINLIFSNS